MAFAQTTGYPSKPKSRSQLAVGLVALALAVSASSSAEDSAVRRVGFVTANPPGEYAPFAAAFRNGLAEGGYIEGKNVIVERRFGPSSATKGLLRQLLAMNVEVLITDSTPAAQAARDATRTIPIITLSGDPVATGLVKSLSHPGGNVTGVSTLGSGLASKRLTLLKELVPGMRRLALLWVPSNVTHQLQIDEIQTTATELGIMVVLVPVSREDTVDRVLSSLNAVDAVIVLPDSMIEFVRPQIAAFAMRRRLPVGCSYRLAGDEDCLLWYGPNILSVYQRLGAYTARILNGARPAELPVEQPTTFALAVNAKTAKNLGLTIPESVLAIANEVIR